MITCLGEGFLIILKLLEKSEGNVKIFKNHEGDLPQELPEPNMW